MSSVGTGDMEPGPMLEPVHVLTFLSAEEREEIPDVIRTKVALSFEELTRKYHNNINQKQKDRIAYEAQLKTLESQLKESRESWILSKEELEVERRLAEDHIDKYRNSIATLTQLEQSLHNVQSNVSDNSSKVSQLTAEKEELLGILNKRIQEIEELNEEKITLKEELTVSKAATADALIRAEEFVYKQIQLEYKEKEVQKEREWVGKQVHLLNAELERKNQEILMLQGETTTQLLNQHSQLAEKNQELRECELSLVKVKGLNVTQESQIERLLEKLRDAESQQMRIEEKYQLELESQLRLCSLYREASEESEKKVNELENGLGSLQGLLNLATERYGELETQFNVAAKSYQEEVTRRETRISKLETELRQANDLLQSFNDKGLTEEMIESLSPSAAIVCKFLKGTFSLTEIYSKLTSSEEDCGRLQGENLRLKESLAKILNDIASRTPALKAQKENYETALETIDALSSQLDLSLEAESKAQREVAYTKQSCEILEREKNRLQVLLRDNASQINVLLREIETLRGTYTSDLPTQEETRISGIFDSSRFISSQLVPFRNIEELQLQNSYLLTLIRELTEERESKKEKPKEVVSSVDKYQEAYDALRKEVTELKDLRLKQEATLLSAKEQQLLHLSPSRDLGDGSMIRHDNFLHLQSSYAELKDDFETYRREKMINDQLTLEELEKCRDEASSLRSENANLISQNEYGKEREKIYSTNLESYKKTIATHEQRNGKLNLALTKQEDTAHFLRNELVLANDKLARAEVSISSMRTEITALKETKVRLEMQLDLYKREERTAKVLESSFVELKHSLDFASKKVKAQLEGELESLQNEINILRKKSQSQAEEIKISFYGWENAKTDLESKLKRAVDGEEKAKADLFTAELTIRRQGTKIDQLQQKVNTMIPPDSTMVIQQEEQLQLKTAAEELLHSRIAILEEQVKKKDEEVTLLSNSCVEWERLGKALEEEVRLSNRELTEEKLRCKDEMIRELQSKVDSLEKVEIDWRAEKEQMLSDVEKNTTSFQGTISRLNTEIGNCQNELETCLNSKSNLENIYENTEKRMKELELRLAREVSLHVELIESRKGTRKELEETKEGMSALMRQKTILEVEAEKVQQRMEETKKYQEEELNGLRASFKELEGVNGSLQEELLALHNTLQEGTQELEKSFCSTADDSFGDDEENKSSKHWTKLLRYMRRQKEIAYRSIEKSETKILRLESQLNYAEKQLKEVSQAYAALQADSCTSLITSAKTQELMEKIETLSALTDSNMMLREQDKRLNQELETMERRAKTAEDKLNPLTQSLNLLETRVENMMAENSNLRDEVSRWKTRSNALIDKANKFNPEEMKRVTAEKEVLAKELNALESRKDDWEQERKDLQEKINSLQATTVEMATTLTIVTARSDKLVEELNTMRAEKATVEGELEKTQEEIFLVKEKENELTTRINNEVATSTTELEAVLNKLKKTTEELEEHKATVKHVKNIARRYKKYYEDSIKEGETPQKPIDEVELPEGVEVSLDCRLQELTSQNETLKKDMETLRVDTTSREERAKMALKTMRDKVSELSEEKIGQETELSLAKTKVTSLEGRSEEVNIRLAAMKSQYEGRLNRLEKEKKEMKDSDLNRQNDELKKEVTLQKQRILALEKQLILKNSGEGQTSGKTTPGDKTYPSEPPKANIKPIAGPSATKQTTQIVPPSTSRPQPTASIRPMAMTRKATVLPTTAATQAQGSTGTGTLPAPVSQAQVSTSTPDQSSQCTLSSHLSAVPQTTGGSTTSLRQATVQPTPATQAQTTLPPPPHLPNTQTTTQEGTEIPLATQEPPSTSSNSHVDSEMGDSSEQVSSSEPSSQVGGVPAVLPRSDENPRPLFSEAGEGGTVIGREEPSPSTSSSRPSQSSKRSREDEVETSDEVQRDSNSKEPPLKRTRLLMESVVDREAEPMGAHAGDESQDEEEEEEQMPHSGRRRPPPEEDEEEEDKDSVIVLDSEDDQDDEDEEEVLGDEEEDVEAVEEYDDEGNDLIEHEDPEEGREAESMEEMENESIEGDEEEDEERIEGILQGGESEGEEEKSEEEEVILMDGDDFEVEMNQEAGEASPANPHVGNEEVPSLETRQSRHAEGVPLQHQPIMTPSYHMFGGDDGEERIVPSTPTLFHPRRTDGFAEAVSSPQVSSIGRQFIFGADEGRVDFHHYEEGSGRSVPTTPLQVSPPVDVGDEEEEEAVRVEEGEVETGDGQPSSSNANSHGESFPATPAITVTTPFEGASASEDDRHATPQLNTLPTESGDEIGASVTSSDEDKVERRATGAGTSTAPGLRPKATLASSDASSSPGEQQQRTRPTPIVWDQPTSSSAAAPLPPVRGHRGRIGMGQMRTGVLPSLRPPVQEPPTTVRGPFRGRGQSARRSRPHGISRPRAPY